uniref:Uncharacterized protein n=1 Tax=Arundo donax TaxID=35708 RepID=A0A0A8Z5R6_ARUDO
MLCIICSSYSACFLMSSCFEGLQMFSHVLTC